MESPTTKPILLQPGKLYQIDTRDRHGKVRVGIEIPVWASLEEDQATARIVSRLHVSDTFLYRKWLPGYSLWYEILTSDGCLGYIQNIPSLYTLIEARHDQ